MKNQLSKSSSLFMSKIQTKIKNNKPYYVAEIGTLEPSSAKVNKDKKAFNIQDIIYYINQIAQTIYEEDPLHFKLTLVNFFIKEIDAFKLKFKERAKLMVYTEQSLKYEGIQEIDIQIQKQWKKNALFFLMNGLWTNSILKHQFTTYKELIGEYHKYRQLVTNLSYYYFNGCLSILEVKKTNVFEFILNTTSHYIINRIKGWKDVHEKLMNMIVSKKVKDEWYEEDVNLDFDLNMLKINKNYIDSHNNDNQLPQTTQLMKLFAHEPAIPQKIILLNQIRATFLKQLQNNQLYISKNKENQKMTFFEKDDIIESMIYCIIKGQIKIMSQSILILNRLLGSDSTLLSKKGVDSYKADIECAAEYLCKQQMISPLIHIAQKKISEETHI